MAESNREELLSTIAKKDVDGLIVITDRLHSAKSLTDTIIILNSRRREELWDGILGMCMSTLLESQTDESQSDAVNAQILANMHKVLFCITRLAMATLKAIKQADKCADNEKQASDIQVPASLHETAIILHGILPTLPSERNGLKNVVSSMFESWWSLELPGREELMANTLPYLLDRSTQQDSAKLDVSRLVAVHEALSLVDLGQEGAEPLVDLLLKCCFHTNFVTTPHGMQFLAFLFNASPDVAKRQHERIKEYLPSVPSAWGSKYGEIYFRAWQKSSGDQREYLEMHCIQDLMNCACRMQMGGQGSLWSTIFKILNCFHSKKTQRGVEDMLTRLYGPILWRSLKVCNSHIRQSAAQLMFSAFPLQSSSLQHEEADTALQRQFDAMHNLLLDPVPAVRLTALSGVGKVLSIYWELIPSEVVKCFMSTLVEELAFDVTAPAVREAVIKVMSQLCDNHLALPLLGRVLPSLSNFVHDTAERVRRAMLDLLLKLKGLRAVKFYNVVPVDHLLTRLEIETSNSVLRRIMKLLYRSFVPIQESPQQQLDRCKALILTNPGASRQFYLRLHEYVDEEDLARYMIILCRYMLEMSRHLNNASEDAEESETGEVAASSQSSHGSDQTSRKKTRRSSRDHAQDASSQSSEEDEDGDGGDGDQAEEEQRRLTLFRGMTEAVYLMYISLAPKLASSPELRPVGEGLAKKLSVTVREIQAFSQDPDLDNALIALAGHLPSRTLPLAGQSLVKKLRRIKPEECGTVDMATPVKALVQWGKADALLSMVQETLEKLLADDEEPEGKDKKPAEKREKASRGVSEQGKTKKKKKAVGFAAPVDEDYFPWQVAVTALETMLGQAECRPILLARHGSQMLALGRSLQEVVDKLRAALSPDSWERSSAALLAAEDKPNSIGTSITLYVLHLRLAAFLCTNIKKGEGDTCHNDKTNTHGGNSSGGCHDPSAGTVRQEASKFVVTSLTWGSTCLLPWLRSEDDCSGTNCGQAGSQESSVLRRITVLKKRREVLSGLLQNVLRVVSSLMMVSSPSSAVLDEAIHLCLSVFKTKEGASGSSYADLNDHQVVTAALACLYQLLTMKDQKGKQAGKRRDTQAGEPGPPGEVGESSSGKSASIQQSERAEIVCTALATLFNSLSPSCGGRLRDPAANDGDDGDRGADQTRNTEVAAEDNVSRTKPAAGSSGWSEMVRGVTPLTVELVLELTRRGQTSDISHKAIVSVQKWIMVEVTGKFESEDKDLNEEEALKLPHLTSNLLQALKRRPASLRVFWNELTARVKDTETVGLYQAQALVAIVGAADNNADCGLTPHAHRKLCTLVAQASRPADMDEDIFKEIKSSTEKLLQNMEAQAITV